MAEAEMAEIDKERLYKELLVIQAQLQGLEESTQGIIQLLRTINREAAEGQARIDSAKANYGMGRSEQRRCPK